MIAVLGGNGFLGSMLSNDLGAKKILRNNLDSIAQTHWNQIIIAAPTGNRLIVGDNPVQDFNDCRAIVEAVQKTTYDHLIYISTVDVYQEKTSVDDNLTVQEPAHSYGKNRHFLERSLSALDRCHVVRLPSLCHPTIKKNILFDLSSSQWLDKISLDSHVQWYPIKKLAHDINWAIKSGAPQINFVSPPISNRRIIQTYFPELVDNLSSNSVQSQRYNVRTSYSDSGYWISESEIWKSFTEFFQSTRNIATNSL
jgi:hypothetical protein